MANTIATPSWTIREVGRFFMNSIEFIRNVKRTYDSQFKQAGARVGNTVRARLPQRFVANDGQGLSPQNLYNETVPITLTNQKNIGFGYSSAEATTELDLIREMYVSPAAETLGNAADALAFEDTYRAVYNSVGTPGTTPTTKLTYLQAGVKLTDMGWSGKRCAVLDPLAMANIADTTSSLFNPQSTIGENYKRGMLRRGQLGIDDWYEDPNRPSHTTGTFTASTPLTNGAGQTGSSLVTDGWASGATALKKGDKFTVAGVYSVNPVSKVSTGRLQDFVITADISDTTGDMTVALSPSIITSGALQTVDAAPADGAAISVWSTAAGGALATTASPTGLVFAPDAFVFVMADLARPNGGANSEFVRSKQAGISIRYVEQYQILEDQNPSRLDILIGAAAYRPEWAVRVQG